jgi:hypothetical protein
VPYVEGLNGETARRSRVSALAAKALMNNAGQVAFSLACICLQGAVMVFTGESGAVSLMPSHLSVAWHPFEFHALPYRILTFSLSSLFSWL